MLSLDEMKQIVDIDQVYAQLSLLQTHSSESTTLSTSSPTSSIQSLSLLIPSLETLTDQTTKLASLLSHTATLADTISGKVRLLDRQQTNVQATIKHIDGINNVKHCARGVVQALEDDDCELAAEYIQKVLVTILYQVDLEANDIFDVNTQSENPILVLKRARDTLKTRVSDLLDTAIGDNKEVDIMRYVKIFPQIGLHDIGLDRFSAFLCGLISRACQESMREISSSGCM
jgi:hypothetical protein